MAARCSAGPLHDRRTTARAPSRSRPTRRRLGPYRGVGRPGACFAIERTIDEVARAVGRDPVEVRIENMIPPDADAVHLGHRHALRHRRLPGERAALRRAAGPAADPRAPAARRAGRAADRHRLRQLHRADRAWRRRVRLARRLDHPRLRELHRAHPDRRQPGADGRHPVARPGAGDGAVADRLSRSWASTRRASRCGTATPKAPPSASAPSPRAAWSCRAARWRAPAACCATSSCASARICCNASSPRCVAPAARCIGPQGLGDDRRDRQGRASADGRVAAGRRAAARGDRDLRAGDQHRRLSPMRRMARSSRSIRKPARSSCSISPSPRIAARWSTR